MELMWEVWGGMLSDGSISRAVMGLFCARGEWRKIFLPLAGSRTCPQLCLSLHMASTMWGGVKN